MADEVAKPPNPFDGVPFGRAVRMLRDKPDLASDFDATYKDEEEFDTFERARLHSINSFYRGTVTGATGLKALSELVANPPPKEELKTEISPVEEAQNAWAQRLRQGVKRGEEFKPLTREDIYNQHKQKYESVLDDLANYERMTDSKGFGQTSVAVLGALAGGIPTVENVVAWPLRGATALGRIASGAVQGAAVNVATDPIVQALNMSTNVQKDFDWLQFGLSGPMGAVIGGGLVGAGELISKALVKNEIKKLVVDDPAFRNFETDTRAPEPAAPFAPGAKTGVPEAAPKKAALEVDQPIETPSLAEVKTPERPEKAEIGGMTRQQMRGEPQRAPDYQRPPETVESLQTMVKGLEEEFGVAIRQRSQDPNVKGLFSYGTGVIEVAERPDFSVAAHEVGHALERKADMTPMIRQHTNELELLDYDQSPITGRRNYEGYAEFVRLFMTNPAYAVNAAPGFYSTFVNHLESKHPKTLESLVGFQKAYQEYLRATPTQAVSAMVKTPKTTWGESIVAKLTTERVAPTVRNVMSLFYDAVIHKDEDIYRGTRELLKGMAKAQGGLPDLKPGQDPRMHYEMLQASAQRAQYNMLQGVDGKGPSLSQALTTALGQPTLGAKWDEEMIQNFGTYLVARRGVLEWDRFSKGEIPNHPFRESRDFMQEALDDFEKKFPQFKHAGDMIHEWRSNYLARAYQSGAIVGLTKEAFDKLNERQFYVPLRRDVSDRVPGKRDPDGISGLPAFQGSMRDVINPITQMMNDSIQIEHAIARQKTLVALRDLARGAETEGGRFVEEVPAHEVKAYSGDLQEMIRGALRREGYGPDSARIVAEDFISDNFVSSPIQGIMFRNERISGKKEPVALYAEGGELKAVRLSTKEEGIGLYEIMQVQPKMVQDIATQILSLGATAVRVGVTTNPAYAIKNLFRDQFAAMMFIPKYIPFFDAAKGMRHEVKQDEVAQLYSAFGGVSPSMLLAPMHQAIEADINSMRKQGYLVSRFSSIKGLANLMSVMENATRLGAFEKVYNEKVKQGLSPYDASMAAARESTDLLDWGRNGSHLDGVNRITQFMNSWIQGMDKVNRHMLVPIKRMIFASDEVAQLPQTEQLKLFLTDPVKHSQVVSKQEIAEFQKALYAWSVGGAVGAGLGFVYASMMSDKDAYRDATPRIKGSNVVVPLKEGTVFLLPKPWELSLGFTAGEYLYSSLLEKDPRAAGQFADAAWEAVKPIVPIWSNPAFKVTSELMSNFNSFSGAPIVPERMMKLPPEEQYTKRTSNISKKVGKVTGWSPMKVDYALNGFFGYWGRDVTTLSSGNADDDPTMNLINHTLLRTGLRDEAQISEVREKFWKHMGKTTGEYSRELNFYNLMMQSPDTESRAKERFDKLSTSHKAWIILNTAGTEGGEKKVFTPDDRRTHPFVHTSDALSVLNQYRYEVSEGKLVDSDERKPIRMTPGAQKKVDQIVAQMGLAEMTNALNIMGEPGYANRPLFDLDVFLARIDELSPEAANELKQRYATKKIYKTEAISLVHKRVQEELLSGGSDADLGETTDEVKAEGYELGAERERKRRQLRRAPIKGTKQ